MNNAISFFAVLLALAGCAQPEGHHAEARSHTTGGDDLPNDGVDERTTGDEPAVVTTGTRDRARHEPMIEVDPSHPATEENYVITREETCAEPITYYDTDSAELDETDEARLAILVDCIQDHLVHTVVITGHADPRHTAEYNLQLAAERADVVAAYLIEEGVRAPEIVVVSQGETEASEHRLEWAEDRRATVDVRTAE